MTALTRLVLTLSALALVAAPAAATRAPGGEQPVGTWPLRPTPEVVAGFELPSSPWGPGHRGVDLGGTGGQRIHAALPGTVSFVGMIAGRGVVVIDHGDTRTTYEPVTSEVARGTPVAAGDVIGALTLPGSHCFPAACLHWGWIRGQTYLDPLRLVGGGPVRLLPLAGLVAPATPPVSPYVDWRPLAEAIAWARWARQARGCACR